MSERRTNPRIRCRIKVGVVGRDGAVNQCWSYDISKDGLQILYPIRLARGEKLDISMNLLDRGSELFQRVLLRTRVVHSVFDTKHQTFRTGLSIDGENGLGRRLLEREVERLLAKHLLDYRH